jgi:hypothetical protein
MAFRTRFLGRGGGGEVLTAHENDIWKLKAHLALLKSRADRRPNSRAESLIADQFPPRFEEFHTKRFNLLWRGSSDSRANTLTLISDTKRNRFSGFTQVK